MPFYKSGIKLTHIDMWYHITESNIPNTITVHYGKSCAVRYDHATNHIENTVYLKHNGRMYLPHQRNLLRYSETGIVTEDFIPNRLTLLGKTVEEEASFSIDEYPVNILNQLDKWKSFVISTYSFALHRQCFCMGPDVVYIKVSSYIGKDNIFAIQTMEDVFSTILTWEQSNPSFMHISYHPTYGYPFLMYIDHIDKAMDDELLYHITDLTIGEETIKSNHVVTLSIIITICILICILVALYMSRRKHKSTR